MKATLEIVRVTVLSREDAQAPNKLFVSYKGWWRLPMLRVPLSLAPLDDGVSAAKKDGKVTLMQKFESGRAPTLRVKGRDSQLLLELCAGARLRTRAVVRVGDLVSGTAPGVVEVPFEVKVGGKVEDAFLTVAQVFPVPTPPPPPVYPGGHRRAPSPVPMVTFPLGEYQPSAARLQRLVQEMHGYGPMPDPAEWLLPPSSAPRGRHDEAASMPPDQCEPAGAAEEAEEIGDAQNTQTNTTAARSEQEDEQLQQSPQMSPSEAGASYVRLWTAVFGEPARHQREGEEETGGDTPHSVQTTPDGVTKQYLRLWTEVFGNYSAAEDCESHSAGEDRDADDAAEEATPHSVTGDADAITRCRKSQRGGHHHERQRHQQVPTEIVLSTPHAPRPATEPDAGQRDDDELLRAGGGEGPERLEVVGEPPQCEQHGEGGEGAHWSPQVSPSQVGARYARLWTEVFGEE